MQTFYVVIKKDYFALYEKNGDLFEKIYLSGNPEYRYSINSVKDSTQRFLTTILEEYNLDSIGEIDLIVIDNEDEIITESILKAFDKHVKERVSISKLILKVLMALDRDPKMHISEYGVNFDGKKYGLTDNTVIKAEFSLLAYSLSDDMLIKYAG